MSEIRVTYSGLVSLLIGLSTAITGLVFVLIITRNLTPEELGTWGLIGALLTYAVVIEPMISYWITREVARGKNSGKTAILTSGGFSAVGILVYIIIAYFVGLQSNVDVDILLFAFFMIPLMFLNRTLTAISIGWKTHVSGYGLITFDIVKIAAALFFIYYLDMGVSGAILSLTVAYVASIIILTAFVRSKLNGKIKKEYIVKWLKLFWLPSYIKFQQLVVLDVLIFSLITGSVFGISYWVVASAVSTLLKHTGQFSKAVYPKLLSGGKQEYLQDNLSRLLYFGFPFAAISIAFARPTLFALNPEYESAFLVVVFLTIRAFVKITATTLRQSLQGIENVDTNEKSTYKDYLKSKLFHIATVRLIHRGVYLGTLAVGLIILVQITESQIDLVIYWAITAMIVEVPFFIYFFIMAKRNFSLKVGKINILKYLFISIGVFGFTYLLTEKFLIYNESIFVFLPNLLGFILIGVVIYSGITYLVDKKTRILAKAIINEIVKKK